MMKEFRFEIRFTTPAFLGDAEQNGRWRAPPFKAQLRQWWRIAYAADRNFNADLETMRRDEGLLFGNAWLSHREGDREVADHRKSSVRFQLSSWAAGTLKSWEGLEQAAVHHPEVQRTGFKVGPHAYLGYGPLDGRGGTKIGKANAAIQAGENAALGVAFPMTSDDAEIKALLERNLPRIEQALWLMDRYGAVGGRSRNGWGSYALSRVDGTGTTAGELPLRRWQDCLDRDWPHAIGRDDRGPLIWQTTPFNDWKPLMRRLAEIRIGLRTRFRFTQGGDAPNPEPRHWLSYPVTHHSVRPWGNNARLPNSLRFKVRPADGGRLVGVIFHVLHLPPLSFQPDRQAIEAVWQQVHRHLDAPATGLTRVAS